MSGQRRGRPAKLGRQWTPFWGLPPRERRIAIDLAEWMLQPFNVACEADFPLVRLKGPELRPSKPGKEKP